MTTTEQAAIRWPDHYSPANTSVHVRNEIDIAAPPERVWSWLVRAALWPQWYRNSENVNYLDNNGPDLALGTRIRWKTFGVTIVSQVQEYVPGSRLAWNAKSIGLDAYHAWLVTPTANGCHVLTEETQRGLLARANSAVFPNRMFRFHQIWLESLAGRAATGAPPKP